MGGGGRVVVVLNMTFWDEMTVDFWWVCAALSFFHALCRLVFIFIGVVVRFFAVQLARFALALNAVVVGFLRTDEGPAGVMDNFITEKADY